MDIGFLAVFLDRCKCRRAHGHDALLPAFAEDADGLGKDIDVAYFEADEFRETQAAAVEKFENGGVPRGHPDRGALGLLDAQRGGEQFVDLLRIEDDREILLELGEEDFLERIVFQAVADGEKFVEGAKGGEVQPDRGPGHLLFAAFVQVAAKMVRREFLPRRKIRRLAELGERVTVVDDRARGGVALDFEEVEKLVGEAVALWAFQSARAETYAGSLRAAAHCDRAVAFAIARHA